MHKKSLVCIFLAISLVSPLPLHGQEGQGPPPGEPLGTGAPAPSADLADSEGGRFDLSRYLGKTPVVLSFWSIYCDSCVDEMLSLQKLEDKYQGEGLVIAAVNEDIRVPKDRISRFLGRLEKFRGRITYPLLYDEDSRVFKSFGVSTLPTLVLIDRQGNIAGYTRGFDPEGEPELLSRIEALVKGKDEVSPPESPAEGKEVATAQGEAALCGFFDGSGWRKSFTGSDSLQQEMEHTRELARRAATRRSVTQALQSLGIDLYSHEPMDGCISSNGIHLSRDPFDTGDPISNLLGLFSYSDFFETVQEQEMLIDKTYYVSREVRVSTIRLRAELESLGYLFQPFKITFTYVNMSRLDQKAFVRSLLSQSRYIGRLEEPQFNSYSTSQVLEVYTSSQNFADEILGMDFGDLTVFVEEVTPTSLELEVWK